MAVVSVRPDRPGENVRGGGGVSPVAKIGGVDRFTTVVENGHGVPTRWVDLSAGNGVSRYGRILDAGD